MVQNPVLSGERSEDDTQEFSLRPQRLEEFIGQTGLKQNLRIFLDAARQRQEALEHVLFYGPPGLGKTTLAFIMANELGTSVRVTSGPAIERPGDLAAILTSLASHEVLFIDEIHRLNRAIEEVLYSAMEDFKLDVILGKGPAARTLRLDLKPFTLVGATTKVGSLSAPLRDRFGAIHRMQFYDHNELCQILQRSSRVLNIVLAPSAAETVAVRSRGTPRVANRLLRRMRDFAQVHALPQIDVSVVEKTLELLHVDARGLDDSDRRYLDCLISKFRGGPVGLDTMAAALSEDAGTIEDVLEPYLIQEGLIERTPKGRKAMPAAFKHLGLPEPAHTQAPFQQAMLFGSD
jgi:Holliday junction DNA helicase RuvB